MSGFNQDDQGFFQGGYEQQSSAGYDMGGGVDPYSVQEPQFGQFDYSQGGQVGGQVGGPGQQQQQQQYGGDFYTQPPMQSSPYTGSVLTPDTSQSPYSGVDTTDDFENEPPLMEELGINFDHIVQKTMVVLNPLKQADCTIMTDTDLAGPLVFCLAFGGTLLLVGKVQFGFIYGIGVVGCLAMYGLLNLMSMTGVSVGCIISVLGYCLLPMVLMSSLAIVVSLQGLLGIIVTAITVFWCSLSASKLFVSALAMDNQQLLVAYPCALLYGVFALLSVF